MEKVVTGLLMLVGIIHLLPSFGVLWVEHLAALYGVSLGDANHEILMRHRAVLFGLLGIFSMYAAVFGANGSPVRMLPSRSGKCLKTNVCKNSL